MKKTPSSGGFLTEVFVEGSGVGWAFIRGRALVNFFCLYDGRLISMWMLRLGGDRPRFTQS